MTKGHVDAAAAHATAMRKAHEATATLDKDLAALVAAHGFKAVVGALASYTRFPAVQHYPQRAMATTYRKLAHVAQYLRDQEVGGWVEQRESPVVILEDSPYNLAAHAHLLASGYTYTRYPADVDDGDAENGPGRYTPAFDEYTSIDEMVYISVNGTVDHLTGKEAQEWQGE